MTDGLGQNQAATSRSAPSVRSSLVTSSAPAGPRETSAAPKPRAMSVEAASTTAERSPSAAARSIASPSPPTTCASSWEFGLTRSGAAAGFRSERSTRAARAASEVSTATRNPCSCAVAVILAYQSSGNPGGRDPASTTQWGPGTPWAVTSDNVCSTASDRARPSAEESPGELILVVTPLPSVRVRFTRTPPPPTKRTGTPLSRTRSAKWPWASAGTTASTSSPAWWTTVATLTPFPPAWSVPETTRLTPPTSSGPGSRWVRSILGLGVTVMITCGSRPFLHVGGR